MKKLFFKYLFLIIISLMPIVALADDPVDPDEELWNEETPDQIPVDGGLSLFLAAGVGYGIKKANDLRKKKNGYESPNEIEK